MGGMRRLVPTVAALILLLLAPAAADAARKSSSGKHLWATVNICDSPDYNNVIGIRASMPGNGTGQRMLMHFSAEYYDDTENAWRKTGSSSPWRRVGSARYVSMQAGFSFQFADPPKGTRFMMRGVVRYQWRAKRSGRVLKRAMRVTKAGYKGVVGGVPAGRSDATCMIGA
jgi:hypothetical protein